MAADVKIDIAAEFTGKKAFKHLVLRSCALGAETRCIGRIERDPHEDEGNEQARIVEYRRRESLLG